MYVCVVVTYGRLWSQVLPALLPFVAIRQSDPPNFVNPSVCAPNVYCVGFKIPKPNPNGFTDGSSIKTNFLAIIWFNFLLNLILFPRLYNNIISKTLKWGYVLPNVFPPFSNSSLTEGGDTASIGVAFLSSGVVGVRLSGTSPLFKPRRSPFSPLPLLLLPVVVPIPPPPFWVLGLLQFLVSANAWLWN